MKFVLSYNGITDQLKAKYENKGYYSIPMLFNQEGNDGIVRQKPLFSFEGIRPNSMSKESAILIAKLNVSQMNPLLQERYDMGEIETFARKGNDTHGSQLLEVENDHFLWPQVKKFALGHFKAEDGLLAYEPGDPKSWSPLICKGRVTVRIVGVRKATKQGRSDSYKIELMGSKGSWCVENISAGKVDKLSSHSKDQQEMDEIENEEDAVLEEDTVSEEVEQAV